MTNPVHFIKMHGIGNDFIIIDMRQQSVKLTKRLIAGLCNRRTGIGCDQLVTLHAARKKDIDVAVKFYNKDGTESSTCGNASRCIAQLLLDETQKKVVKLQTKTNILTCKRATKQISVDMGKATFDWWKIPLQSKADTLSVNVGEYKNGIAVNVGNPHVIFFNKDIDAVNLELMGPKVEIDPLFPERVNVSIGQVISPNHIRLKVWERGSGITLACGSAACAAVAGGHAKGLISTNVDVDLPGGCLNITIADNQHLWMTGATSYVFDGTFDIGRF